MVVLWCVLLQQNQARVAPTHRQSIPRLELLGTVILARLVNSIMESLTQSQEIETITYWTDSMTTFYWITNEKPWTCYVQNRVNEIRQLTNKIDWRFCPGTLNPADLPSRGATGMELSQAEEWWNGPKFLWLKETQWPKAETTRCETALIELLKRPPTVTHSLVGSSKPIRVVESNDLDALIDCNRFSKLLRLLRVTAYVLRYVRNIKLRLRVKNSTERNCKQFQPNKELTAVEIDEAELLWTRTVQENNFKPELENVLLKYDKSESFVFHDRYSIECSLKTQS